MRPWQQVVCIRLSLDGTMDSTLRYPGSEVEYWLEFNGRRHTSDALIVGDEVKSLGAFAGLVEVVTALNGRKKLSPNTDVTACKDCTLPTPRIEIAEHEGRCWNCDYSWRQKMKETGGAFEAD